MKYWSCTKSGFSESDDVIQTLCLRVKNTSVRPSLDETFWACSTCSTTQWTGFTFAPLERRSRGLREVFVFVLRLQLDSAACKEMSVSDTEVSDVTWTDNGTFNLSEGHTPQTENSEGTFRSLHTSKSRMFSSPESFPSQQRATDIISNIDLNHRLKSIKVIRSDVRRFYLFKPAWFSAQRQVGLSFRLPPLGVRLSPPSSRTAVTHRQSFILNTFISWIKKDSFQQK